MRRNFENLIPFAPLVGIVFIGLSLCCYSPLLGGDAPGLFTRQVVGVVEGSPGSRLVWSKQGGHEKIAIILRVKPDVLPAQQVGDLLSLECVSTRCAALAAGETHQFYCRLDGRFFTQPVIECQHDRMLAGKPRGEETPG